MHWENKKVSWCFTPSQPVRLYQGGCLLRLHTPSSAFPMVFKGQVLESVTGSENTCDWAGTEKMHYIDSLSSIRSKVLYWYGKYRSPS